MNLKIVSPTKEFFNGEVESVYLPTIDGHLGILENHENLITVLDVGELKYKIKGQETSLIISGGFVKITSGNVYILADEAEMSDELVAEKIQQAIKLAEEEIEQTLNHEELVRLEKTLKYHKFKKEKSRM